LVTHTHGDRLVNTPKADIGPFSTLLKWLQRVAHDAWSVPPDAHHRTHCFLK
jgi:hypothetical protein